MVLMRTQGTATNPRLIQVWLGLGQTLGHCFAYDAVISEQQGASLHYPLSWDEVDGTGAMTFSWELRGQQGIYHRGHSRRDDFAVPTHLSLRHLS